MSHTSEHLNEKPVKKIAYGAGQVLLFFLARVAGPLSVCLAFSFGAPRNVTLKKFKNSRDWPQIQKWSLLYITLQTWICTPPTNAKTPLVHRTCCHQAGSCVLVSHSASTFETSTVLTCASQCRRRKRKRGCCSTLPPPSVYAEIAANVSLKRHKISKSHVQRRLSVLSPENLKSRARRSKAEECMCVAPSRDAAQVPSTMTQTDAKTNAKAIVKALSAAAHAPRPRSVVMAISALSDARRAARVDGVFQDLVALGCAHEAASVMGAYDGSGKVATAGCALIATLCEQCIASQDPDTKLLLVSSTGVAEAIIRARWDHLCLGVGEDSASDEVMTELEKAHVRATHGLRDLGWFRDSKSTFIDTLVAAGVFPEASRAVRQRCVC